MSWTVFKYNDKDTYPEPNNSYNVYVVGIDELGYIKSGYSIVEFTMEHNVPLWNTLDEVFAYTDLTPEQKMEKNFNLQVDKCPKIIGDPAYDLIKLPLYKRIFILIDNWCKLSKDSDKEIASIWENLIKDYTIDDNFFLNDWLKVFAKYQITFVDYRKNKKK